MSSVSIARPSNAKLKRIVADLSLDKAMLQNVLSEKLLSLRANVRLSTRLKPIGKSLYDARVCYGYRRVRVLLKRDGWPVNLKRIYRLYKEMELQLRNKVTKRRVKAKLRADRIEATRFNHVWAIDFVHDQLATGRRMRILTVVDTFSRFSPEIDARFSYRGEDVIHTLERVCRHIGYPASIRVDIGSEFISRDLDLWAYHKGVVLDFSRPGKPKDNSYI